MKFEDFKVLPGQLVQLQVADDPQGPRLSANIIGLVRERALLISPPRGRVKIRNGQKLTGRITLSDGFCLFTATLLGGTAAPVPVCYLSYPEQVSHRRIRVASRVDIKLPVQVLNCSGLEEVRASGHVTDISTSGARLELPEAVVAVGDQLTLTLEAKIDNLRRQLVLNAMVRSRVERSTREIDEQLPAVFGLEFVSNTEDAQLLLCALVYRQLVVG